MDLYEIEGRHYIGLDQLQRAMGLTVQAFELLRDRYQFTRKPLGIVYYDDVRVMTCQAAYQLCQWHLENAYPPSSSVAALCRDLKPHTRKIPKRALSRSMRIEIAYRQSYQCNVCRLFPIPPNFEVDHIVELQDGGEDVAANLQALCPACHAEKTRLNRLRKHKLFRQEAQAAYAAFVPPPDVPAAFVPPPDVPEEQVFSKYFSKNTL